MYIFEQLLWHTQQLFFTDNSPVGPQHETYSVIKSFCDTDDANSAQIDAFICKLTVCSEDNIQAANVGSII